MGYPMADLGTINIQGDRKSTRLNSSHQIISYAVFCLKKNKQPLDGGRIGQPSDLDGLAVYFMSDLSRFTTGQVVAVDGGLTICFFFLKIGPPPKSPPFPSPTLFR